MERLPSSVDGELRRHPRMAVMEVLPSVTPDLDALLPTLIAAEQDHLERFRERRLPRAVPSDHEGEAGSGIDVQGGGRSDATEAFHLDAVRYTAAGAATLCATGVRPQRPRREGRRRPPLAPESREDEGRRSRPGLGLDPIDDEAEQSCVRHQGPLVWLSRA